MGGPPTSAMRAAVIAPPLSRAGCPGQGPRGPWCHRGSTPASHNGEQAPSVKGNTSPAPRQLGKGFTLWISLKTLEFCSDEDAGSCGNVSFTEKQKSTEKCFRLTCQLSDVFLLHFHASDVLIECCHGSSWEGSSLHSLHTDTAESLMEKAALLPSASASCAQTLPPHTCLYMQIVCLLLTDEC